MNPPKLNAMGVDEAKAIVANMLKDADRQALQAAFNATVNVGVDEATVAAQEKIAATIAAGIAAVLADPAWAPYLPAAES